MTKGYTSDALTQSFDVGIRQDSNDYPRYRELMTKTLTALALAGVLFGCSSGGSDNNNDNAQPANDAAAPTTEGATPDAPAPAAGGVPTADSKAGVWLGDFGTGSQGVYVIDNDNSITGLAIAADGSASSVFGSLGEGDTFTGVLDIHAHPASDATVPGVFAPRGELVVPSTEYSLNIVNGQTIESTDGGGVSLVFGAPGSLTPATVESLAGSWQGSHSFCNAGGVDCQVVSVNLTFNGTDVTGNTSILAVETGEVSDFSPAISGSITPFGDVMATTLSWNDLSFAGVIYFDVGGNLILNTDDTAGGPEDQTLSSSLTPQ